MLSFLGAGWLWGGMALVLGGSGLGGAAPHTPFLAFFFLTCAMRRLGVAWGGSAHVISCFFTFWRVRCGGLELGGAPPHTPFLAFFFLACAPWWFGVVWGGSAHAISCFFLFDVCDMVVWRSLGRLRTRHFLPFSFWRVHAHPLPPLTRLHTLKKQGHCATPAQQPISLRYKLMISRNL